jgi:hypothetical protein
MEYSSAPQSWEFGRSIKELGPRDKMVKVKRVRILSVHSSSEADRSLGVSALSDADT